MTDECKVKRVPVDYRHDAMNPDFLKFMARIAHYASGKYGSYHQYKEARLIEDKSPINHALEHMHAYGRGEAHDHFGPDVRWQLAAAAYNLMIEFYYVTRFGFVPHPLVWPVPASVVAGCPTPGCIHLVGHTPPCQTAEGFVGGRLETTCSKLEAEDDVCPGCAGSGLVVSFDGEEAPRPYREGDPKDSRDEVSLCPECHE